MSGSFSSVNDMTFIPIQFPEASSCESGHGRLCSLIASGLISAIKERAEDADRTGGPDTTRCPTPGSPAARLQSARGWSSDPDNTPGLPRPERVSSVYGRRRVTHHVCGEPIGPREEGDKIWPYQPDANEARDDDDCGSECERALSGGAAHTAAALSGAWTTRRRAGLSATCRLGRRVSERHAKGVDNEWNGWCEGEG